jgi:glucose/arabinose dehydrogenase
MAKLDSVVVEHMRVTSTQSGKRKGIKMQRHNSPSLVTFLFLLISLVVVLVLSASSTLAKGKTISGQIASGTAADLTIHLENYAAGLNQPVGIANAGDYRLFVLERQGLIKIVQQDGSVLAEPFLDVSSRVESSSGEQGLLGLAFHPRYYQNGFFYVNYTNTTAGVTRTRISRFQVSADPNIALPGSENILLTVTQPYSNHNAGRILFGPDGYLYVPLGDGGGGGDPDDNAQNPAKLLGKISRIDVDKGPGLPSDCKGQGSGDYTIPADNPFVSSSGTCDEIWASGLRNPWQSSFDALTGDLFIADVGQNLYEEVNFQPAGSAGGENYGWRCYEGNHEYNLLDCQDPGAYTFPILEYAHSGQEWGCSVTGGYIYRGSASSALYGRYLLTDYCSGRFWDLVRLPNQSWQSTVHNDVYLPGRNSLTAGNTAFGQRCDGELFLANISQGKIYQIGAKAVTDLNTLRPNIGSEIVPNYWVYLPMLINTNCR